MAMATKRTAAIPKLKSAETKKTASAKPVPGKAKSAKGRAAPPAPAKIATTAAASHILPAAKGARTVSHRKIKKAVEKVFRERASARG